MKATDARVLSDESGPKRAQEELDQSLADVIGAIKDAANRGEYTVQGLTNHATYVKTHLIELGYAVSDHKSNPTYLIIEWRAAV